MTSPLNPNHGLDLSYLTPEYIARQDARDARRLARLAAAGHTHTACSCCGDTRGLPWTGWSCTNADPSTEDGRCPGVYRAQGGESQNPGDELAVTRAKGGLV